MASLLRRRVAHPHLRLLVGMVTAVLLTAAVAGCGDAVGAGAQPTGGTTPRGDPDGHNQTDIDFAQMMLVHTRQSINLVTLAAERSESAEVLAFADEMAADDTATIASMALLLDTWGVDEPDQIALAEMDHSQMDHESIGMGFMAGITDDQVTLLASTDGESFDNKFLKFMLIHRGAAVAMAQNERLYGQASIAIKAAKTVETDQADQMDTIQQLRGVG